MFSETRDILGETSGNYVLNDALEIDTWLLKIINHLPMIQDENGHSL